MFLLVHDLEVIFDIKLFFAPHLNTPATSNSRGFGFIIRNSHDFTDYTFRLLLYNNHVLTKVEYYYLVHSN